MTTPNCKLTGRHRAPIGAQVAGDSESLYHIIPMGESIIIAYDADGEPHSITEVVDQVAIDRIMAAHTALAADPNWPGYLIGQEHYSQDPDGSTAAYAWGLELQARTDDATPPRERGIWMRAKKTSLGEGVIGDVYKFFSTVNDLESIDEAAGRYRPVNIVDIGATNQPHYRTLMPARHSAAAAAAVRARPASPTHQQEQEELMLEKLKLLLARHKVELAADAGEDAVRAALDKALTDAAQVPDLTQRVTRAEHRAQELEAGDLGKLTVRAEKAETRVAALEKADLETRADAFVALHKALIKDPKTVRDLYIKSPDSAEALLGQIKPPAADQDPNGNTRVMHRADATTPDRSPTAAEDEAAIALDRKRDDYVKSLRAEHRLPSFSAAWTLAQQLKPELFA